jgi:hypothetical protein
MQQLGHQQPQLQQPQLKKLPGEMRRLDGFFNPISTTTYKQYKEEVTPTYEKKGPRHDNFR